tara:strand:+ start:540 stop:881 length:342 start_codon:yes stop_codon:yes gene_type:complete
MGDNSSDSSGLLKELEQQANDVKLEVLSGDDKLKDESDFIFYVFTPKSKGINTIVNVVNDSNYFKGKTIFLVLNEDNGFTSHQVKSLIATGKMVKLNGGQWFDNWNELIEFLK